MPNDLLRKIPKIDQILSHHGWDLMKAYPQETAKDALREYIEELRAALKAGTLNTIPSIEMIISKAQTKAASMTAPTLKHVINGTGTIIHTNLGRSLLADTAIKAIVNVASSYSNLEYDLIKGTRGDRYEHCLSILSRLTGAENALVVNNNAGAVFLVLNTLADGKEVLISRGGAH